LVSGALQDHGAVWPSPQQMVAEPLTEPENSALPSWVFEMAPPPTYRKVSWLGLTRLEYVAPQTSTLLWHGVGGGVGGSVGGSVCQAGVGAPQTEREREREREEEEGGEGVYGRVCAAQDKKHLCSTCKEPAAVSQTNQENDRGFHIRRCYGWVAGAPARESTDVPRSHPPPPPPPPPPPTPPPPPPLPSAATAAHIKTTMGKGVRSQHSTWHVVLHLRRR